LSSYAAIIDNGKTSAEGFYKAISTLLGFQGVPTITTPTALQVVQHAGGANMSVDISVGSAFVSNQLPTFAYNVWTDAVSNLSIAAASVLNPRIDAVVAYINMSAVSLSNSNNPGALAFFDVQGTPAGSPTAPNSSAIQSALGSGVYWILLGYVTVPQNATQIVTANISDQRPPFAVRANLWGGSSNTNGHTVPNIADDTVALLNAAQTFQNKTFGAGTVVLWNGWQTPTGTFTYAGNNGNKEFLVTTSNDLRSVIGLGDKLSVARGTTPPTQCMSFTAASSQSATKSSPSGIAFTGDFSEGVWLYLLSYPSANACLLGQDSAGGSGSGWEMGIDSLGQIYCFWRNASGTSQGITYQSVPLNRWIHIATSATVATPTVAIYLNGTSIPVNMSSTAATSVVQATAALTIGKGNSTTGYINGYISEARLWSNAQSGSSIRSNMAINLTGSETNLIGLWQGNGNFNDSTTNANNLTANSGAIATQAANPYNAIEYGYVTAITSSQITVFTGTDCAIPNQTLGAFLYSHDRSPYGFPTSRNKWRVSLYNRVSTTQSSPVANTWYNIASMQLLIPTGEWSVSYRGSFGATCSSVATGNYAVVYTTLSTANNSESDIFTTGKMDGNNTLETSQIGNLVNHSITNAAATTYYLNEKTDISSTSSLIVSASNQVVGVVAEIAYA